jgi:hypothetical protein
MAVTCHLLFITDWGCCICTGDSQKMTLSPAITNHRQEIMNQALKSWARKERKKLKLACPFIYDTCFEHLSDEEFMETTERHRAQLVKHRGDSMKWALQLPDGRLIVGEEEFTVPREEGIN